MSRYFCLLLLVLDPALASSLSAKQKTKDAKPQIIDIGEEKDITEINKGLGDDIMVAKDVDRSAVNDPKVLWSLPMPYVLDKSLELNAKGVIMRSLDQFRLKSCIDFKVKENEIYYISVEKQSGCYSYIGQYFANGQTLSIGSYCDTNAIVEHEFLHALGFYHEQSRPDRDEHVIIEYDNIQSDAVYNFRKVDAEETTTNQPYDYTSVMHYGSYAFSSNGNRTIVTFNPTYQEVIGQRLEMSPSDVTELNLLYKCKSSIAFLTHCSFSNKSTCGVNRCTEGLSGWESATRAMGGPNNEHTNLKSYSDVQNPVPSSFMYASTVFGNPGDSAWMETKRMTPSRSCAVQCLQFYYFHSGNELDQLNIWIREFRDENDLVGQSRQVGQITGQRTAHWKYHHVSLGATNSFQVEFEARKGAGSSSGGFSIDDINMSELECPHVAIQIDDFETVMENTDYSPIYSSKQYTNDGYAFRMAVLPYGSYYGMAIQLVEGKNDDRLQWPLLNRQATFQALDQNPNIQLQMSKQRSMTSDSSHIVYNDTTAWDNPRTFGKKDVDENGQEIYVGPLIGRTYFGSLDQLKQREFIKGGSAVFLFSFQDITPLINGSSLPCIVPPPGPSPGPRGPCVRVVPTTFPPPVTKPVTPPVTKPATPPGTKPATPPGTKPATPPGTKPPTTHTVTPTDLKTTTDNSIFGFAPGLMSSALLVIFSPLLLLFH